MEEVTKVPVYWCSRHGNMGCAAVCRHLAEEVSRGALSASEAVVADELLLPKVDLCGDCLRRWGEASSSVDRETLLSEQLTMVCIACFQDASRGGSKPRGRSHAADS